MRTLLAAALLLGACGRVGFEGGRPDGAAPDGAPLVGDAPPMMCAAPAGHDEDADGVDDACDVCPQRGTSQADADADGVGDDCDPDPGVMHTRTMFEPFLGPNATWQYHVRHLFLGDALGVPLDPLATVLRLPGVPSPAVFEIGGRIGARGATGDHLVSISFGPISGVGGYYCELYDGIGGTALQLTQTLDGTLFTQIAIAAIPGTLEAGTFRIQLIHTPPDLRCIGEWKGQVYDIAGASPDLGPLQPTTFFPAINVEVEYDHAVRLDLP